MPNLLGTAPNQVPTNGDLGKLAFMDVVDTVTNNPYLDTAISDTKPSLLLDFANSKTLDPRITYTRASTATYYDGKTTAVAEQNLLTYSEQFDNAYWQKNQTTVTANTATAPNGSLTADSLIEDGTTNLHSVILSGATGSVSGQSYTFSVYVKANGRNYCALYEFVSGSGKYFNITAGGTGSVLGDLGTAPTSAALTYIGNDWYRASITTTAGATVRPAVYLSSTGSAFNYAGDGTSGIYIWGAQVEQRSAVSSYTPTTSSPITNYSPALQTAAAGVPRFDHDPVTGESKGFLIEEQRSNLLTYSEQFDNAAWGKIRASIVSNTVVAPDGTLTGDKLVEDTSSSTTHITTNTFTFSATSYTGSVYLKAGERTWAFLRISASALNINAYFNLADGTVGTLGSGATSASITSVGNGWYRCSIVGTSTAVYDYGLMVFTANGNNGISYTGDGYSGIYIWGAQLEAGSFPTSYIPTTSAQVTRSADSASMTGANFSSWYNQGQGMIYVEGVGAVLGNRWFYSIDDGTSTSPGGCISGRFNTTQQFYVVASGSEQASLSPATMAAGQYVKTACSYAPNSFAMSGNGSSVGTDLVGGLPINTSRIVLGTSYDFSASNYLNGTIKKLAYYPKRLSDAELQEMTQ